MTFGSSPKVVFLDHNVWDFLLERRMDLAVELPPDHFGLWITREAEFEIKATPGDKVDLKAFIAASIEKAKVRTQAYSAFMSRSSPMTSSVSAVSGKVGG